MRSGTLIHTPVLTPVATVTVNGTSREVDTVSITREIPTATPGQVTAVGGMTAATGTIDWAQADTVTHRVGTPWTVKDRPSPGDRVEITAGRDYTIPRVFTGMVDNAPGEFADPGFSSTIVDDIDRLKRRVSWDPLALVMPPWDPNTDATFKRMTGLTDVYVIDRCLRAGGFNATPPRDVNSVVSAPLMGCTWPEQGALLDSCRVGDIGRPDRLSPRWTTSRWGVSTFDAYAEYLPFLGTMNGKITTATPLNITLMSGVSANLSTSGYVQALMGDGTVLRLAVTSSRSLMGQIVQNGTTTTVVTLSQGQAGGEWSTATLRVYPSGTGWEWEIQTDLTAVYGYKATGTSAVVTTSPLDRVRVNAPEGSLLGGAQVSFAPLTRSPACLYQRTARVWVRRLWYLTALPTMPATEALSILQAQAEASWAGLWIDEDGVAQWWETGRMTESAVVAELTATDSLLNVAFEFSSQDVHRRTIVKYTGMATSTSRKYRLIGHEGGKDELAPGDAQDVWITPDNGTHWIEPHTAVQEIYGPHGSTTLNRGTGTLIGFTGLNADGDEVQIMSSTGARLGTWDINLEKVGQAFHYTASVTSLPSGVDRVRTAAKTTGTGAYLGIGLPVIRTRGIITESEQEYTSPVTGPEWAEEYEHPGSWFIQHADQAKEIGDRLAYQLNTPRPVVESVDIIPDPRLQLGDKVRVTDDARTGVSIVGVITRIDQTITAADHTMSLRLMVTEVTTPHITLAEFDAWYSGMTLAEVDALHAGKTLAQLDAAPLI